jgi:dolichyl-diphosphooligosaccharide---protein glycosyltransferase
MWISNVIQSIRDPTGKFTQTQINHIRAIVFGGAALVGGCVVSVLAGRGYFGPLSSRVRGLFVQHTRTGNPLVDSVAEHQPASAGAYFQYLHHLCYFYPFGLFLTWFYSKEDRDDSKLFIVLYGCIAYYFSSKMVRLVILMGPIGSVLGSVTVTLWVEWALKQVDLLLKEGFKDESAFSSTVAPTSKNISAGKLKKLKRKERKTGLDKEMEDMWKPITDYSNSPQGDQAKKLGACILLFFLGMQGITFWRYSQRMAHGMSQPSIMFQATLRDGKFMIVVHCFCLFI